MLLRCERSNGVNYQVLKYITPRKTNMTIEKQPFEDAFPSKHGDFRVSCWFLGGIYLVDSFCKVFIYTNMSGHKKSDPIWKKMHSQKAWFRNMEQKNILGTKLTYPHRFKRHFSVDSW